MDVKSVGQNIKEIREKKKITQKRLAELSGRGESAISNYESGATDIPCSAPVSYTHLDVYKRQMRSI